MENVIPFIESLIMALNEVTDMDELGYITIKGEKIWLRNKIDKKLILEKYSHNSILEIMLVSGVYLVVLDKRDIPKAIYKLEDIEVNK